MRFEIRYFFLEIGLSLKGLTLTLERNVFNFKPHYILSLSTGLRAQLYSASSKGNVYGHAYVVSVCATVPLGSGSI